MPNVSAVVEEQDANPLAKVSGHVALFSSLKLLDSGACCVICVTMFWYTVECPAVFVPEEERETGIEGALNGAEEEVHAGADCEPVTAS